MRSAWVLFGEPKRNEKVRLRTPDCEHVRADQVEVGGVGRVDEHALKVAIKGAISRRTAAKGSAAFAIVGA